MSSLASLLVPGKHLRRRPVPTRIGPNPSTIYGLPSGREPGFGYVEHGGRTVGIVGSDGRIWMASYRGQPVGEHRTKRDAVAEVRRRAALDIARVG